MPSWLVVSRVTLPTLDPPLCLYVARVPPLKREERGAESADTVWKMETEGGLGGLRVTDTPGWEKDDLVANYPGGETKIHPRP